jgi:hypothetical protein
MVLVQTDYRVASSHEIFNLHASVNLLKETVQKYLNADSTFSI